MITIDRYGEGSWRETQTESLLGKTLVSAECTEASGSDAIHMVDSEGMEYVFYHYQNCCEDVSIESVIGDLKDLVGTPITLAELSTKGEEDPSGYGSNTWSFYKFATIKGYVDIRWYGSSNGYYSEEVDLVIKRKVLI